MYKIGVVLAGGASKGVYEIGCLRAIADYFGIESIKCISSASVGSLIAQSFNMDKAHSLEQIWKDIDTKRHGRFFLSYSGNDELLDSVCDALAQSPPLPYEHWVSIWNFTKHKLEYIPFHNLFGQKLCQYIRGAVAVPFFAKGEIIDNNRILDGAFVDNIPVYPLLDKELDFIFCIYFDNYKYIFENQEFDKKIIKLRDFPNTKMLELMAFRPDSFDSMVTYGYNYTMQTIQEIFSAENKEEIYTAIDQWEKTQVTTYKPRLTADVVLNNINIVTKRYSKRLSSRVKDKSQGTTEE